MRSLARRRSRKRARWPIGFSAGQFSFPKLAPIEYAFDARKLGPDIPVPYFVIQGRDDHIAPLEVARDYVAEVRAPKKAFIPIDGGHWACFTNAPAFVEALRRYVKPLI